MSMRIAKAWDVSEADAAALWASRSVGPLAYREFLVSSALGRCAWSPLLLLRRWRLAGCCSLRC